MREELCGLLPRPWWQPRLRRGCASAPAIRSEGCGKDRGSLSLMRLLKILCLLAAYSGAVRAQTEQPGVFHETATGLTMRFPVELVVRDAQKSINEGHVAVFGSMQNEAKEHELASRCMKPILLAELPDGSPQGNQPSNASAATLFLFEFIASKECKAGFKYKDDEKVAGGVAPKPRSSLLERPL